MQRDARALHVGYGAGRGRVCRVESRAHAAGGRGGGQKRGPDDRGTADGRRALPVGACCSFRDGQGLIGGEGVDEDAGGFVVPKRKGGAVARGCDGRRAVAAALGGVGGKGGAGQDDDLGAGRTGGREAERLAVAVGSRLLGDVDVRPREDGNGAGNRRGPGVALGGGAVQDVGRPGTGDPVVLRVGEHVRDLQRADTVPQADDLDLVDGGG